MAAEVFVRVRAYADGKACEIWLIRAEGTPKDGVCESCHLHGRHAPGRCDEIAAWFAGLGVRVEREASQAMSPAPHGISHARRAPAGGQGELFVEPR